MSNNTKWLQLTITCDPQLTDPLSDFLVGVLSAGVEIGVEDRLIVQTLHAFVEVSDTTEKSIGSIVTEVEYQAKMLAEIFEKKIPEIHHEILEDQDWSSNWKKHFKPFAITEGLVIKPTWEEYAPKVGEQVIEMDPGMAFGTGHHATTSLCMKFIRDVVQKKAGKVLDVGTGTGILAMAAALFGADQVLGIDNDPDAVDAAKENVIHNGLQETVRVAITPLDELAGEFSFVVANIIHDVLVTMRDDLARLTEPAGMLVLSGILKEDQAANIVALYEDAGFTCLERAEQNEWAALLLQKSHE